MLSGNGRACAGARRGEAAKAVSPLWFSSPVAPGVGGSEPGLLGWLRYQTAHRGRDQSAAIDGVHHGVAVEGDVRGYSAGRAADELDAVYRGLRDLDHGSRREGPEHGCT